MYPDLRGHADGEHLTSHRAVVRDTRQVLRSPRLREWHWPLSNRTRAAELSVPAALFGLLVVASSAFIVAFVVAAAFRLTYPFPLEVTEGAAIVQVQRVLEGQPLYLQPTLEHVPLIYGPLYFYVSSLVA